MIMNVLFIVLLGCTLTLGENLCTTEYTTTAEAESTTKKTFSTTPGTSTSTVTTTTSKSSSHASTTSSTTTAATAATATTAITSTLTGTTTNMNKSTTKYKNLVGRIVFGEAGGEPQNGKLAVAWTIVNRVGHAGYPNTLTGVVAATYANGRHEYNTLDVKSHTTGWNTAKQSNTQQYKDVIKAATGALSGTEPDPTKCATDFCGKDPCSATNSNKYWEAYGKIKIGAHWFVCRRTLKTTKSTTTITTEAESTSTKTSSTTPGTTTSTVITTTSTSSSTSRKSNLKN